MSNFLCHFDKTHEVHLFHSLWSELKTTSNILPNAASTWQVYGEWLYCLSPSPEAINESQHDWQPKIRILEGVGKRANQSKQTPRRRYGVEKLWGGEHRAHVELLIGWEMRVKARAFTGTLSKPQARFSEQESGNWVCSWHSQEIWRINFREPICQNKILIDRACVGSGVCIILERSGPGLGRCVLEPCPCPLLALWSGEIFLSLSLSGCKRGITVLTE